MSRPSGAAFATVLALALLVAPVVLPLATADHAYSHRYVVFGRIVDAAGNPIPSLLVDLGYKPPFQPEGPCANQPGTETEAFGPTQNKQTTNQFGEFTFCFHTHQLSRIDAGTGIVRISELDVIQEVPFDGYTRVSFVPIVYKETSPRANTTLQDATYTVLGRLWQPSDGRTNVEGIPVYGHTIDRVPVNITMKLADGTTLTQATTSNNYGDFAVRVPVTARPTGGTVVVEALGKTFESALDPKVGATSIRGAFPEPEGDDSGIRNTAVIVGVILGIAVVGGGGWYAFSKLAASRAERLARESSTRRRSNRR